MEFARVLFLEHTDPRITVQRVDEEGKASAISDLNECDARVSFWWDI